MFRKKPPTPPSANLPLLIAFSALLLFLAGLYASAIRFGLIWDDPEWYVRVVGRSFLEVIKPSPDYQFYRPGLMVFNRLFVRADETLDIYLLHWTQVGWYLINLALLFAMSRRLGFRRWAAFMVVVLAAWHPFVYQAVAWAAPGQPLTAVLLNTAWVLYLLGRGQGERQPRAVILILSLFCFFLSFTIHEIAIPLAGIPLLFEMVLRLKQNSWRTVFKSGRHPWQNGWGWPLLYLVLALLFFLMWLFVPRESGITGLYGDWRVYAYFLQGFVYPFASTQYAQLFANNGLLVATWVFLVLALWGVAIYRKRGILAAVGLVWAFLGIAPSLVGLPYSYVSIGSRLFYTAVPGVAWLWVAALWPMVKREGRATAVVTLSVLLFVALFGLSTTLTFRQLYSQSTTLLAEVVETLAGENGRTLFINFPDRYRLKEEPLAIGYWGITLAPVVVDLAEFPALLTGSQAQTTSRSMPWVDGDARDYGPYHVDMRGVITQPEELYQLAVEHNAVFVTRYDEMGNFELNYAGSVEKDRFVEEAQEMVCKTAVFDKTVCLQDVQIRTEENTLIVRTEWWTNAVLPPHLSLFTHVGLPDMLPVAQMDGHSWQDTLPLSAWQPGDRIVDERRLALPPGSETYPISLGLYNWVNGERLPGVDAQKRPLPDNIYVVPISPASLNE